MLFYRLFVNVFYFLVQVNSAHREVRHAIVDAGERPSSLEDCWSAAWHAISSVNPIRLMTTAECLQQRSAAMALAKAEALGGHPLALVVVRSFYCL